MAMQRQQGPHKLVQSQRPLQQPLLQPKFFSQLFTTALISASLIGFGPIAPSFADSRLNSDSASGTRVNSDPESLLRYGLPVKNKEVRDIQGSIESIKMNLKTRRIPFAQGDVGNVRNQVSKNMGKILTAMPPNHLAQAKEVFAKIDQDIVPLSIAMTTESKSGSGSLQERKG
jgi:hypothetical protein